MILNCTLKRVLFVFLLGALTKSPHIYGKGTTNVETVIAVVQKLVLNGKHGEYAVVISEEIQGAITFSLKDCVWHEQSYPELGTLVILSDLRLKRAGWRAYSGRFVRPSDQHPSTQCKARSTS